MLLEEINFLSSQEGKELIEKYQNLSEDELYRELMKNPEKKNPYLSSAVTLIKLRKKAFGKFSKSSKMFFTPLSLEQSTGEEIARYIAAKFGHPRKIVDLTCSIGGNLIFLASQSDEAVAIDKNEINIALAKLNSRVYSVENKIEFICGDAYDNIVTDADAFFIDPARGRAGKTKTRSILNSEPNLLKIIPSIFEVTKNLGVKISPAFDYKEMELLPLEPEIEVISEDNVCKVVMLWFGEYKTCRRRATCLIDDKIYSFKAKQSPKIVEIVDNPSVYLYEPNKAIIKAHLIEEVAEKYGLSKINRQTSFLTNDSIIEEDKELFRVWEIKKVAPFSIKEIQSELKAHKINRVNIITKRFPQKPAEIYKKLKVKEGSEYFLIITVLRDEKYYYILAKRV